MEQNNELYHYGILGMKWGIRRYQNEDGSLTEAGIKHYGSNKVIGDPKRITRATDAAEVKQKIDRLEKRKVTRKREEKIDKLKKMHSGLVSDLDDREIEYGKLKLSFKNAVNNRAAFVVGGPLGGAIAGGITGLAWALSEEGKHFEQLRKEFKDEGDTRSRLNAKKEKDK